MNNGLKGWRWKITNRAALIISGVLRKKPNARLSDSLFSFPCCWRKTLSSAAQRRFHNVGGEPNDWWGKSSFYFYCFSLFQVYFPGKEGFCFIFFFFAQYWWHTVTGRKAILLWYFPAPDGRITYADCTCQTGHSGRKLENNILVNMKMNNDNGLTKPNT